MLGKNEPTFWTLTWVFTTDLILTKMNKRIEQYMRREVVIIHFIIKDQQNLNSNLHENTLDIILH